MEIFKKELEAREASEGTKASDLLELKVAATEQRSVQDAAGNALILNLSV